MRCVAAARCVTACSSDPKPPRDASRSDHDLFSDVIPVAHTPPGVDGNSFPPPILATGIELLAQGAPDLPGIWMAVHVERDGERLAIRW